MGVRARRLIFTAAVGVFGFVLAWMAVGVSHDFRRPIKYPFLAQFVPLPHHVPKYSGGVSLRFAMVHDVLVERFPRHGPAYYRERNRVTREKLATLAPDDPARFPLADDLGAGLERLGQSDEAVAVLRDKLAHQEARGLRGRDLYTTFANLGTFLIHGSFRRAQAGEPAAKARFREGLAFIHKSVEVNPEAHFGREQWQAALAEFLQAAMDDPGRLKTFDFLGDRLDLSVEEILNREINWTSTGYGRSATASFSQGKVDRDVPAFFLPGPAVDSPARWPEVRSIRDHITKIGAESDWDKVPVPSHRSPVPFDEPVLGIIGMWRQGGGASPHFALALGEVMLRVGQRYIAWEAFERASRLSDRFWPDPALQQSLRDHCQKRQQAIERTLLYRGPESARRRAWQRVSPPPPKEAVAALRSRFDAELAFGEGERRAYQDYEAARIAAGVPIDDPRFFDEFSAHRKPIASPVGPEEWYARVPGARMAAYARERQRALGVFVAGASALAAALLSRLLIRPAPA